MSITKLKDQPPHLQDRYGYRRTPVPVIIIATVAGAAVLAFSIWTANRFAHPPVRASLLAWSAFDDHTNITWEAHRSADTEVECALRVQDRLHQDVGYALVTIPAGAQATGGAYVQETYSVATRAPGFAAELLGCAPKGDLAVIPPDFPPGESNPNQPWRLQ